MRTYSHFPKCTSSRRMCGGASMRGRILSQCARTTPCIQSNVVAVEHSTAKDVLTHLPPRTRIAALGFYTCRAVRGGEDLFINYGPRYNRGHYANPQRIQNLTKLVGPSCKILKGDLETPAHMAATFGLHYVDDECYDVY